MMQFLLKSVHIRKRYSKNQRGPETPDFTEHGVYIQMWFSPVQAQVDWNQFKFFIF